MSSKQIVVVGGGFAGLEFMRQLKGNKAFVITLVDVNNYHFFPPLLYQVSSSFIEPSSISYPFRRWMQGCSHIHFHLGAVKEIHVRNKEVHTENGILKYDILVLSQGTETNFFGLENVRRNALPMKTLAEALALRNHLLASLEAASRETDERRRAAWTNVVIAGGGPTGVELAGMLSELARHIGKKEYPELPEYGKHIYLVDAGASLLGPMSESSRLEALMVLKRLGVDVRLNNPVKDYDGETVILSDGTAIPCKTLIWASGVQAREIKGLPGESIGKGKRVICDAFHRVEGMTEIYAIGDASLQMHEIAYPHGHPQVAQVAIQQGKNLAMNFSTSQVSKWKAFQYKDKGSMAIISKYKAVADFPRFSIKGFSAWILWLFIHIFPLVGFRNKLVLAFNWFWAFITNDPTLRMMIRAGQKDGDNSR